MSNTRAHNFLLVVPVLIALLGIFLSSERGPYYLADNFDPEYNYLLNSLNLLTFHIPAHNDHPGTTLQLIGAVTILLKWMVDITIGSWRPLREAILTNPETYLHVINLVLNGLIAGAVFAAGRQFYRCSHSLVAALLLQANGLFFLQTIQAQTRVSPEPLLLATGLFLLVPLAPVIFSDDTADKRKTSYAIAAGGLVGFGLVTKVTFLPWVAVVLLFKGRLQKLRFFSAVIASATVFLIPIFPRLPIVATWLTSLFLHNGMYGNGPVGLPNAGVLGENLLGLVHDEPLLFLCFLLYGVVLLLHPCAPFVRKHNLSSLLWTALIAITVQTLMTIKHPAARYILPALVVPALVNAALSAEISHTVIRQRRRISLVLTGSAIVLGCFLFNLRRIGSWITEMQRYRDEVSELTRVARQMDGCRVIGMYSSSVPTFALNFGNAYANFVHGKMLQELYPDALAFSNSTHNFYSFTLEPKGAMVRRMVASGQCIVVQGTSLGPEVRHSLSGLTFDQIALLGKEALYKVSISLNEAFRPLVSEVEFPRGSVIREAEDFEAGSVERDTTFWGAGIGVIVSPRIPAYAEYHVNLLRFA